MISLVFKEIKSSDFIKEAALARVEHAVNSFSHLKCTSCVIVISADNSNLQTRSLEYSVKIIYNSKRIGLVELEKKHTEMYEAIRLASDELFKQLQKKSYKFMLQYRRLKAHKKQLTSGSNEHSY